MSSGGEMKEDCHGWAARDPSGLLSPYKFGRSVEAIYVHHFTQYQIYCHVFCLDFLAVRIIKTGPHYRPHGQNSVLQSGLRTGRDPGPCFYWVVGSDDVSLKITHCGVCYADVIWTKNKHGDSKYPLVPGHEIVGIVKEVGSNVHHFKVGDHVGVGTYVNSCRDCEYCGMDMDIYCSKGAVYTFNCIDADGTVTRGGYSSYIVVHERYCFRIPNDLPLALAAPLLCAGITVYSPMIRHKMNQPGKSLGVIGLGGLGHLAVKFGKAFGLSVTVFSTSISKKDEALNKLGADNFVISSDEEHMKAMTNSLNFIIDSASGDHPIDQYMPLLKTSDSFVLVGFPSEIKINPISLIMGMKTISGSATGGTKETQEMLDFCATQKIYPEIEMIPIDYINEALERMIRGDVKYRFVIDIENSLK